MNKTTLEHQRFPLDAGSIGKLMQLEAILYKSILPVEMEQDPFNLPDTSLVPFSRVEPDLERLDRERVGLSAQAVREVFPDMVHEGEDGKLGIYYIELIPVLIEALKDQQRQIDELQSVLQEGNAKSAFILDDERDDDPLEGSDPPVLYQNAPNPSGTGTRISYYLPRGVKSATLYIYNMQGMQVRSYMLHGRGHDSQLIHASELIPGMYIYTLVVDGREVATRRMILTG